MIIVRWLPRFKSFKWHRTLKRMPLKIFVLVWTRYHFLCVLNIVCEILPLKYWPVILVDTKQNLTKLWPYPSMSVLVELACNHQANSHRDPWNFDLEIKRVLYIHYKVWDKITHPFPVFIGWSWGKDNKFHPTPYFVCDYIIHARVKVNPCW